MRAVTNNLMACLLLLQAAFGICCHAPEACADCRASAERIQLHVACCERCAPASPDDATPPCPTDRQAACHGFCTYVKADAVNVELRDDAMFALAAPSIEASQPNIIRVSPCHLADTWAPSHPVRLHVLYQVILI